MYKQYRKTQADIFLDNIIHNYDEVKKRVGHKILIPVVKANAYGHGAIEVTRKLVNHGVDIFAVSLLEEALELREVFKDVDILVMGVVGNEGLQVAADNNVTLTITSFNQIKDFLDLTTPLKIHIKMDTGMHRLGFNDIETVKQLLEINHPNLIVDGIYTHFATADCDEDYYKMQLESFKTMLEELNYPFNKVHCSNSSASIKYESEFDFTTHARLGISLYGCTLDEDIDFLKETMAFKTKISHLRRLKKGDKLGYGITYEAKTDEWIGVLPVGYADGFIRQNQNGYVSINNKRYQLVGRICMDQCFIRVDKDVSLEDTVYLFGNGLHIDEVAKRLDTINYEVLCVVGSRVPRVYK